MYLHSIFLTLSKMYYQKRTIKYLNIDEHVYIFQVIVFLLRVYLRTTVPSLTCEAVSGLYIKCSIFSSQLNQIYRFIQRRMCRCTLSKMTLLLIPAQGENRTHFLKECVPVLMGLYKNRTMVQCHQFGVLLG